MGAAVPNHPSLAIDGFAHHRAGPDERLIHYVTAGSTGTPVVLLHGFPETWFGWRALIPLLSGRHRIIAPDMTGLGGSARPADGYEKTAVAADIGAVLDAEGVTGYHLVGADMGGPVGFSLAMTDRDRARSFTFIASALPGFGLERLYDHSAIGVNAWYWTLFQHPTFGPMLTAGHQREMLTSWAYRGSALDPDAISAEAIEVYLESYADPNGWRAAIQYYATLEQDARDNARLIDQHGLLDIPTLGIDGEQDGHLSTATLAQIARSVRGALIPDCKHWVAEEQPGPLSELLLKFFATVEAAGSLAR